jgi:hypothetical protein
MMLHDHDHDGGVLHVPLDCAMFENRFRRRARVRGEMLLCVVARHSSLDCMMSAFETQTQIPENLAICSC